MASATVSADIASEDDPNKTIASSSVLPTVITVDGSGRWSDGYNETGSIKEEDGETPYYPIEKRQKLNHDVWKIITRGGQTKGAPSPAIAIGTADPTPRGQPAAFRGETLEVPYKRIIAIQEGKPEECKLFNRFDHFNNKYNICGQHELRQVFLKWKNDLGGTFYSELLKEVIDQLPDQTCAEIRLSVHGVSKDEFDKLAEWAKTHNLISKKIKWIIQVPRLYDVYKEKGLVKTFQELLDNVFLPLFECTNSPKSHQHLSWFLQHVVGFDTVDDESKSEPPFDKDTPTAADWTTINNPPYQLYNFYFYANIAVLNRFRALRKMNVFAFRPHCGEAPGSIGHLISSFMSAQSVNDGTELRWTPVLQYLYYICNVGLSMAPSSNNALFTRFIENPIGEFVKKGLNVAISTDDPLIFALTKEPLLEEYSIVGKFYRLSQVDVCELAAHSVHQSGFSSELKKQWLGTNFDREDDDDQRTNVPKLRMKFRRAVWNGEVESVFGKCKQAAATGELIPSHTEVTRQQQ